MESTAKKGGDLAARGSLEQGSVNKGSLNKGSLSQGSLDRGWWLLECAICLSLIIYLLGPWRWIVGDLVSFSLAVLALGLWPRRLRPRPVERQPSRLALLGLIVFSVLAVLALWAYGIGLRGRSADIRLILLMAVCYGPFAYLQQLAVQGYLTLRWGLRWGRGHHWLAALAGGLLFSLCHCNCPVLVPPTFVAGVVWARFYLATGQLLPLAASHAILGATIFVFVVGKNPFAVLWGGAETLGSG